MRAMRQLALVISLIAMVVHSVVSSNRGEESLDKAPDSSLTSTASLPIWFTRSTQLCYRWYPDGDGGQCGGGAAQELCAFPNQWTGYYRDDTDKRSGGCRMSWGITSSGFDAWFKNTNIGLSNPPMVQGSGLISQKAIKVFLDFGYALPGHQINIEGPESEIFDPRLQNPGYIFDAVVSHAVKVGEVPIDTHVKCKVKTPSTTVSAYEFEILAQRLEICYKWYADGDSGQCGASGGEYCAALNYRTPYYRDDTDNRSGGCRMSWQLRLKGPLPSKGEWLHDVKLCYRWYADGDGGQCGGGVSNQMCVYLGQWTPFYRDDTDSRGGGCRMSWGLFY